MTIAANFLVSVVLVYTFLSVGLHIWRKLTFYTYIFLYKIIQRLRKFHVERILCLTGAAKPLSSHVPEFMSSSQVYQVRRTEPFRRMGDRGLLISITYI